MSSTELVSAQPAYYHPGPANLDTSRFAHIYFIRDEDDGFPNNWLGMITNDDRRLCVKAQMNRIYRVNSLLTGMTRFSATINGVKNEITVDLQPGENNYVEIKPIRQTDGSVRASLRILKDEAGLERVRASKYSVQNRYCLITNDQEHYDFRENLVEDTIRWYADKKHSYYIVPLPSWETVMRSEMKTAFGFHNDDISKTFSEAGGIVYLDFSRYDSEVDFDRYCKEKFIPSAIVRNRDSLIAAEIKPIEPPPGIIYARLVNIENKTEYDRLPEGKPLYLRSSYVVFYRTDAKGKGHTVGLFDSERGLPEELHSMSVLEDRIRWCWKSFRFAEDADSARSIH